MQKKGNRFKTLCLAVVAFDAVSVVVFLSFGGGEALAEESASMQGFNTELPSATVEEISDDRVKAARIEEERRKKEEMLGITGSSFALLEIEEGRNNECKNLDSLADELETKTREDLKNQVAMYEGSANISEINSAKASHIKAIPDTSVPNRSAYRKKREKEMYVGLQGIYGKEIFPDKGTEKNDFEKPKGESKTDKPQTQPKKKVGFNTMNAKGVVVSGKAIRAVTHGTHKDLTANSPVKLRLLDPLQIGDVTIPRNSFIYGKVSFAESRLMINIDNVNYQNSVLPFRGEIFDAEDGSRGIYVPDNAINEAMKEGGSSALSTTGVTRTAGSGVLANLVSSVANTATGTVRNAVVKSTTKNKVTISENYMVNIKQKE